MRASKVVLVVMGSCAGVVVLLLLFVMGSFLTGAIVDSATASDDAEIKAAESLASRDPLAIPAPSSRPAVIKQSPQDVATEFYEAMMSGDHVAAMQSVALPADKKAKRTIYVTVGQKTSIAALRAAAVRQFGKEAEAIYGANDRLEKNLNIVRRIWRSASFQDYGMTGELTPGRPRSGEPDLSTKSLKFRMMDDGWKIDGVALVQDGWVPVTGSLAENEQKLLSRLDLIKDIRAGKFTSAQEARNEDHKRIADAKAAEAQRLRQQLMAGDYKEVKSGEKTAVFYGDAVEDADEFTAPAPPKQP